LTTDVNGIVSFTQIPQRMRLRVKVAEAPGGAIPTNKNRGTNEEDNSDLNSNGLTDKFQIQVTTAYSPALILATTCQKLSL